MKLSLLLGLTITNCLLEASVLRAFRTPTHSGRRAFPRNRPEPTRASALTTRVPCSSTNLVVLASSSNDDQQASTTADVAGTTEIINGNAPTTADPSQTEFRSAPAGPSAQDLMMAMGTSPRRIFLSFVSATGIALGGNFLGVTSNLLTTLPEDQVEATGIDTYFPRGEYKRCRTPEYTFVVPKEWVADTFVELAKAQRKIQPLDYSMQKSGGRINTLPDSAYGPPGRLNQKGVSQAGDTNVSAIVSSGFTGFTLRGALGSAQDAAETLLSKSIAPEGSGRVATLLRAVEDRGGETYKFEYIIDRGTRGPPLKNIAVIAASPQGDKLFTLTVVAPVEKWKDTNYDSKLRKIADSFRLR